jgi:hypothetical protein
MLYTSTGTGCFEDNTYYCGGDLKDQKMRDSNSAEKCQEICQQTQGANVIRHFMGMHYGNS